MDPNEKPGRPVAGPLNLPPVRHSSTELPAAAGSERRVGTVLIFLGVGALAVVLSVSLATLLMRGLNNQHATTLTSGQEPTSDLRLADPTTGAPGLLPETTAPEPTPEPTQSSEQARTFSSAAQADGMPPGPVSGDPQAALPTKAVQIKDLSTGKCLRVVKGRLAQRTCSKSEKAWKLERTRTVGGVDLYRIRRSSGTAVCLDLPLQGIVPEGTVFGTFGCVSPVTNDNQEFRIEKKTSKGRPGYVLQNWKNQLCVDVSGTAIDRSDLKDGADITLYRCLDKVNGYDDHLWTFS